MDKNINELGFELVVKSHVDNPQPLKYLSSIQKEVLVKEFLNELEKYKDSFFHKDSFLTICIGIKF